MMVVDRGGLSQGKVCSPVSMSLPHSRRRESHQNTSLPCFVSSPYHNGNRGEANVEISGQKIAIVISAHLRFLHDSNSINSECSARPGRLLAAHKQRRRGRTKTSYLANRRFLGTMQRCKRKFLSCYGTSTTAPRAPANPPDTETVPPTGPSVRHHAIAYHCNGS